MRIYEGHILNVKLILCYKDFVLKTCGGMGTNGYIWVQIGANGYKWAQMDTNGHKWAQMVTNGYKLVKIHS